MEASLEHDAATHEVPFTEAPDVVKMLLNDHMLGDGLAFTEVKPQDYVNTEIWRDAGQHPIRFHYNGNHQKLLATVEKVDEPHEAARKEFVDAFSLKVNKMGCMMVWHWLPAPRFPVNREAPGCTGSRGEADAAGKPMQGRVLSDDWPTVVWEVGHTMSLAHLRCKKNFWFNESNKDVHFVILVKVYHRAVDKRIVVEL